MAFVVSSKDGFSAMDDRRGFHLSSQSTPDMNARDIILTCGSRSTQIPVHLKSREEVPELEIALSWLNGFLLDLGLVNASDNELILEDILRGLLMLIKRSWNLAKVKVKFICFPIGAVMHEQRLVMNIPAVRYVNMNNIP